MTVDHNYFSLHARPGWRKEKQIFTISFVVSRLRFVYLMFEMGNFHVIALREKQDLQTTAEFICKLWKSEGMCLEVMCSWADREDTSFGIPSSFLLIQFF